MENSSISLIDASENSYRYFLISYQNNELSQSWWMLKGYSKAISQSSSHFE
jgi:hypothetical protein